MDGQPLRSALDTFERRKRELLRTSAGKWVLIYDEEVVNTYDSRNDGLREGYRRFGNVPFLVHPVLDRMPATRMPILSPMG